MLNIISHWGNENKTTVKSHATGVRMAEIKLATRGGGDDTEQVERPYIAGGQARQYSHSGKQFGSFS